MKWPETLSLVRHDTSEFNALKKLKLESPLYQAFRRAYDSNPESETARKLAIEVTELFALGIGDHNTPLAKDSGWQAKATGEKLKEILQLPDIVFVSPYLRTHLTLRKLTEGWPELKNVETKAEDRLTEQDHGIALIYSDWRVFNVLHPEQRILRNLQGSYWYRYPQGENVPDVRNRLRDWLTTLTRDYSEKKVFAVTHHLTILSLRANLERLSAEEFVLLDKTQKPINSGVTIYQGDKQQGQDGKLVLSAYNLKLY